MLLESDLDPSESIGRWTSPETMRIILVMRKLKIIGALFLLLLIGMGATWFFSGYELYKTAWTQSNPVQLSLRQVSPHLLQVLSSVYHGQQMKNRAVMLTSHQLGELGEVKKDQFSHHMAGVKLIPYVYILVSMDDARELILNSTYFGSSEQGELRGYKMAAQFYLKKDIADLSLADSALLAAIESAPAMFSPRKHPEKAKWTRDLILKEMAEKSIISQQDAERETTQPIEVH